ncbi:MAG: class I SAM-dependent methyltransferase [Pseudomonadales bacterium]|nr:class I SAM-dependent methyltransferase [Pseudomonadales bacterium]
MGLYDKYVLPRFINLACGTKQIAYQRKKVVPEASGRVLEVGIGPGLNLPFYDPDKVELVFGLEPAAEMRELAAVRADQVPFKVEFIDLPGEEIPLDDKSVDTVLLTFTLCTIPDGLAALKQMKRVLKPGGKLIFCEHGSAPDEAVKKWQDRINPIWKPIAGGCNLNRKIPQLIEQSGFNIQTMEAGYIPGAPRFAAYNYWGQASG